MWIDRLIGATIGLVPKFVVRRIAQRYVAGETLDEATVAIRELMDEGCCFTLDLLGEFVKDAAEADASAEAYLAMLERIARDDLDGNVSLKPTAFGLMLDEGEARGRIERVVRRAAELGLFVRLDMEDSPWTDATFRIYRHLRGQGLDNVGLVLQAYLKRTLDDIAELSDLRPSYRLCKGIYIEPEEIALHDDEAIRQNFLRALEAMAAGAAGQIGIATHDDALVQGAESLAGAGVLETGTYEFQMLHGVRPELRRRLVAAGYRVRIYVPFGEDWYGYCVRRLQENPKIGRYVLKAMLGFD